MSLKSNTLVSLALAKDYLDIPALDTTKDTRVERLINMASEAIENFCQRRFITQAYEDFYDGRQNNQILLNQWPVTAITEVAIDNSWDFPTDSYVDASDYKVINENTLYLRSRFFPNGYANVRVKYSAGYGTIAGNNLPSDLQECCLMLVQLYEQKRNEKRIGVTAKSKNGETISFVQDIPEDVASILQKYVRLEFANAAVGIANN